MAALMPQGKQQYFTAGGIPLVGGKVYTYAAGTTTPLATYTTAAAGTPNANPVILDSRGEASIFFSAANYKIVVKDSLDSTIWTQDNLAGDQAASVLTSLAAPNGVTLIGANAYQTQDEVNLERVSLAKFGGSPDASAAANSAAFVAALATGAATIFIPPGNYDYNQIEVNTTGVTLEGAGGYGAGATVLTPSAIAQPSIIVSSTASGAEFTLRNLCITGNATSTAAIQLGTAGFAAPVVDIDNCYIVDFSAGSGIDITNSWWINIRGNTNINGCYNGIYIPPAGVLTTLNIIENSKITNSLNCGIFNEATVGANVDQITINHASIETSVKEAVYSTSPNTTVLINDGYFEGNNSGAAGLAVIHVTSSNAAVYKQSKLILRDSQFHAAYGTYALSLGYVQYSLVENNYGFRQWATPFVTTSVTGCTFNLNRGDGSTIDTLAKIKLLLGTISAFEYDSATGYVSDYNSLPRYQDGDRIFRESHIKSQQATKPTVAVAAGAGSTATAVIANGSTDTQGRIDLTVAGAGIALGQQLTVTFNRTYTTAPLAVLVSYGSYVAAAPALYAVCNSATTFQVGTCGVPVSGLQYINYIVIGGQ